MVDVKVNHPNHTNITTYIDGKQINIRDHVGWTDFETAVKLIDGPFGYEWGGPAAPFNPETWTKEKKMLTWNHVMPYFEGYGYVAQMMLHGLQEAGVDTRIFYKSDYSYVKGDIMPAFFKERRYDCWGIWHHFWMKPNMLPMEKKAMYTMWESTKLNEGWVEACNSVNIVFVPCEENKRIFIENGVKVPIYVVEHGVDQEFYFYRPKVKKDYFTIGTMGSLVPRKNPEVLIQAFLDEFKGKDDVKLVMKDTNEDTELEQKYKHNKNIQFIGKKLSPLEIGELLASFDISVFPSRGEGFGLGGLQSMGVGTTCICTGWNGHKQYLNPEYNYELDYKLVDINEFPSNNTTYSGKWAEADYSHLRLLLRHAYEHQDEVLEKGRKAADWVKSHWTWKRAAEQMIEGINHYEHLS